MEEYLNNIFSGIDDNIRLDDEQKKVILDDSKNIMVIAGAGAGKTTVITAKVKYLIEIKKIKPENILIISFTNKAIEELKQRINEDFNLNVDISTFHSFAYNIVNNAENHKEIIVDNKKILTKLIKKNNETKKIMKYISKNRIYKITKTYRNSQELIDIVGNFVMRNERQIKKNLFSDKKINNPIVLYRIKRDIEKVLCYITDEIIVEYGLNKNILILGRYKKDIDKVIGNEFSINHENIIYRKEKQLRITYLTIHSSKGLGYDNVILIMPNSKVYGFPNNKNEDPIRKFLLPNEEKIMEERRLFYVALTRTKNKVYIVSNKKNESKFVKEIVKEKNVVVKNMKKHNIK